MRTFVDECEGEREGVDLDGADHPLAEGSEGTKEHQHFAAQVHLAEGVEPIISAGARL